MASDRNGKFTLVMPTYNDLENVAWTCQVNQELHGQFLHEIIVGDNNPFSEMSKDLRAFCANASRDNFKVRYLSLHSATGSAVAKDMALAEVKTRRYILIDSHVMLKSGCVSALNDYLNNNPDCPHLLQGPMYYDNRVTISTHQEPGWRGENEGMWARDERFADLDSLVSTRIAPYEIPAQGTGFFAGNIDKWLGFNPKFRGFGAEEFYIHRKYRKAGHKVMCLPKAIWWHLFPRAYARGYPQDHYNKIRNYCIGHIEMGIPLDGIYEEFIGKKLRAGERPWMQPHEWEAAVRGDEQPPTVTPETIAIASGQAVKCGTCGTSVEVSSLDEWYEHAKNKANDINEHCEVLRELSSKCNTVVDCGSRFETSTVALAAGKPKNFYFVAEKPHRDFPKIEAFLQRDAQAKGTWLKGNSLTIAEAPEADMYFIDTDPHTGEHVWAELQRVGSKAKRYLVFHDTNIYGATGADGKPGITQAILQFLGTNPEWFTARVYDNNYGLTVLSRHPDDMPPGLPALWRQAANYAKSEVKDLMNGRKRVPLQIATERHAICTSNAGRCPANRRILDSDRCSSCSCYLQEQPGYEPGDKTGKVWRPLDACPLGYWLNYTGVDCTDDGKEVKANG